MSGGDGVQSPELVVLADADESEVEIGSAGMTPAISSKRDDASETTLRIWAKPRPELYAESRALGLHYRPRC